MARALGLWQAAENRNVTIEAHRCDSFWMVEAKGRDIDAPKVIRQLTGSHWCGHGGDASVVVSVAAGIVS
jgi:hypothetical protein